MMAMNATSNWLKILKRWCFSKDNNSLSYFGKIEDRLKETVSDTSNLTEGTRIMACKIMKQGIKKKATTYLMK